MHFEQEFWRNGSVRRSRYEPRNHWLKLHDVFRFLFNPSSPQAQVNVVGLTNWGFDNYATDTRTLASTALSVVPGPLPNSFSVKPVLGGVEVAYNMMAVNGGATLLVQSLGPTPPQSSAEEPPATGVCNKV